MNSILQQQLEDWKRGAGHRAMLEYAAADHQPGKYDQRKFASQIGWSAPKPVNGHESPHHKKKFRGVGLNGYVGMYHPTTIAYWTRLRFGTFTPSGVQTTPLHDDVVDGRHAQFLKKAA